jgi:hypothetical protein
MFTAAHSWLSRQFSMFVFCILFVFVLCIVSIENRRDNQEWSAVNIGYNTQNEYKQNTKHKHRKLTGQPGQLPIPGCPVSFLCLCFVFCLSLFCVLYPMLTADHSWFNTQNEEKQNTQHKHRKPTGQPGMGSCKHWIQ